MVKLLVLNYSMNSTSQLFSHQRRVVLELSRFFSKIDVLTSERFNDVEIDNVSIFSNEWNEGQPLRNIIRFYFLAIPLLLKHRKGIIFSHMTDVQAALIALPCRVLGIRHVLWYAHKSPSVFLRICYPLINVLVTSTVGSCPLTGRKLVYLGQGIDSSIVKFSKKEPSFPPKNWYHVGRLDPAKNIEKIIESLATFREKYVNTELHLYGSYSSQQYEKYAQSMIQRYSNFNWIHFHGVIPNSKVPLITSEHDGFIHAYLGSLDKALVEAVFLNRFIVSANPEYILQFQSRSPGGLTVEEELVGQLQSVYSMTKDEYMSKIREIYRIAEQNHSLSGWIERLVQILSVKSS